MVFKTIGIYFSVSSKFHQKKKKKILENFQDRLRTILPDRVRSFWDNVSYSMNQSQHLRDAAEEQIQFFTVWYRFL